MGTSILTITDESFEKDVLQASKPVLVDFWAEWCGPCRALAPTLEQIAEQYSDTVTIAKVNIDHSPDIAAKYGIMSIPTLMLFKNGEVAATKMGVLTKAQLSAFIDSSL